MATFTSDMVSGNQAFKPFKWSGWRKKGKITISQHQTQMMYTKWQMSLLVRQSMEVKLKSSDLDGGTALVWDVGDGSDADYYIDGSTVDKLVLVMKLMQTLFLKSIQQMIQLISLVK